jgi:hypothetical protein
MTEHRISLGHGKQLQDISILSYMDCMIREAIETDLHPNNMNREDGLFLSQSWKSYTHYLKGHRNPPPQE